MKYVRLENNKILGYYSKDINPKIPKECLEITDEQWQEALNINANWYENGEFIVKDFRTANEIEEQRVQNINSYTQSYIIKKYPLEKQSSANLGIYGDEYKNEMIIFVSNCISLSNESIENNTSFEDFKAMLNEL
ncbi:hypothetical protein N5T66_04290 [Aliarcobacter cryaerophilus]|uniref:hypothetical protein n=1 Tax=Aliarcobacter cryaerophilus TaxID=28198 RepID=UPI0021B21FE7|nr:hypothetical protein [Aliarcobacter cryaerophilus]MCT7432491.1 hypothetical protein [Aliarcobacter cryaerophilus]